MKKRPAAEGKRPRGRQGAQKSPTLKELADHLGLAPTTVSTVMNGGAASGIAAETQQRIREAARKLNYRPNFFARCLRTRRSFTVGVLVPEVSQGYNVSVLTGIEEHLLRQGYFYFVASHHFQPELINEYAEQFLDRSVDGLIVVCAPWSCSLPVPVATVSSYHNVKGTTSILVDHHAAAEAALRHLTDLGHEKIAFIKGTPAVPDTEVRWKAIVEVAEELGSPVLPSLIAPIMENTPSSPQLGYEVTQKLLASGEKFTAMFAFNDVTAIGAIRALNDCCYKVPEDVSVVGFDDIENAAYHPSGLTTVRQPLNKMGQLAAESVLGCLSRPMKDWNSVAAKVTVPSELVIRGTTGPARTLRRTSRLLMPKSAS